MQMLCKFKKNNIILFSKRWQRKWKSAVWSFKKSTYVNMTWFWKFFPVYIKWVLTILQLLMKFSLVKKVNKYMKFIWYEVFFYPGWYVRDTFIHLENITTSANKFVHCKNVMKDGILLFVGTRLLILYHTKTRLIFASCCT